MMGYRDPNDIDAEQEAEYWDMVLKDFGVGEYIRQRDAQHPAHTQEANSMEFTVSITGTKNVEVEVDDDAVSDAFDALNNSGTFGELEDVTLEDNDTDTVEVEVRFSANIQVEIDEDDLNDLVRKEAENALSQAGIDDYNIETIDAV